MKGIVVGGLVLLAGAAPARAQAVEPEVVAATSSSQSEEDRVFVFDKRPSLRLGRMLRIDLRVKLQGDYRTFDFDAAEVEEPVGFEINRRRLGLRGMFFRHFEYEVEGELREVNIWRDLFVNFRYFDDFQVRAGKFKMPFSLEQLTGLTDLDFVYRSNVVNSVSPGRDVGVSLHGHFRRRALGYHVGVFRGGGENERFGGNPGTDRTVAGRVTARPFRIAGFSANAGQLTVGFAASAGRIEEGPNSLRVRTAFREPFFSPVFVNGRRLRYGIEADWQPGPFSVKGEFIRATDQRKGQGVLEEDLPPLAARGWYVSGTWLVTGEPKAGGVTPRRPVHSGGPGAVELATRYEKFQLGSASSSEGENVSPRGANLLENSDRAWTVGVNWYANRWTKLQLNLIREEIEDARRSPIPDRELFWTRVFRVQFAL